MINELSFTVFGPPQPKQRARKGKGGRWYTPNPTRRYERAVRNVAVLHRPPDGERYEVVVVCYFADARRRDADNVLKSVMDSCNGVLWADDSLIARATVEKRIDRAEPRTEITVRAMEAA